MCAANNTNVEVEGVAILEFSIGKNFNVPVPFLITKNKLNQPIIGYNVIEHVVLSDKNVGVPDLMKKFFPAVSRQNAESVVNLLCAIVSESEISEARTTSKTVVPSHSRCRIKCKTGIKITESEQAVLFSPEMFESALEFSESVSKVLKWGRSPFIQIVVSNSTGVERVVGKVTVLCSVETVSAVFPIFPKAENQEGNKSVKIDGRKTADGTQSSSEERWLPKVDLSHLSKTT